jgi:hypothetical protein
VSGVEEVSGTADRNAPAGRSQKRHGLYVHEPSAVPMLARLVDSACQGASDPHEVSLRVQVLADRADPPVDRSAAQVLVQTFLYIIEITPVGEPRPSAGLVPLTGPSYPVALRDAGENVFTLGLAANRRDAAQHAVRAYLDTRGADLDASDLARGLVRAWHIARQVGLADLAEKVTAAMIDVATDAVDRTDDPYAVIPLLSALIAPAPRRATASTTTSVVDALLDRALTTYSQVHVIKDIATLVRRRAHGDASRVERASRHEVRAMLAEAEAAVDPMVIRSLFNDAAATARRLGVTDLEKIAVARLQAAPPLTWERSRFESVIPARFFDMYLPGFESASDWRRALGIWLHTPAPTGSKAANEASARNVKQASAIRYLMSTVLFRDGDLPARTLSGDDELFERDLVQAESRHMAMRGRFLAKALFQIRARFGIPSQDELEAFLKEFGAAPALVSPLATALQLYWIGEYKASVHLVVPKAEAAARALLLELNEPMYRAAVGDSTGQFPGLGSLLPDLVNNGFDPDWERFLRVFLLGEGQNMRNLVAHGFVDEIDPVIAALALRASAVLILLTAEQHTNRDAATVRAALAVPDDGRRGRSWRQRLAAAFWAARRELQR